jgi:hypothetical protein
MNSNEYLSDKQLFQITAGLLLLMLVGAIVIGAWMGSFVK